MPMVDMPLEKLLEYTGKNPCPADIDEFWDRSLAEMRAVDPQVELVKADFQTPMVECFDMYFTGVKNARVHAKLLKPKNLAEPAPALLRFHGYSGSSGDWSGYLGYAANGFVVAALDARGQSGTSEDTGGVTGTTYHGGIIRGLDDGPENILMRHIFLDTAQLAGLVMTMPEVDETRVGAYGGSQGGGLTYACAALEPRITKAYALYPFLSDYKRVWEMDLAKAAYEELAYYFRYYDPLHEREEEIFTRLGYVDIKNIAKRIRAEFVMATGLLDTVCPPSTQFAAYNQISSNKRYLLYPDYAHQTAKGSEDLTFRFFAELLEK